jgi:hypothetical protein
MPRLMRRYDVDDLDDPDADRICRDGEIVMTPMTFMDAATIATIRDDCRHRNAARLADADQTLHRPGSLPQSRTAASAAAAQAWEARGAYLADAWRSPAPPPPSGTGSIALDSRPAAADAQAAWEARGAQLREAWR